MSALWHLLRLAAFTPVRPKKTGSTAAAALSTRGTVYREFDRPLPTPRTRARRAPSAMSVTCAILRRSAAVIFVGAAACANAADAHPPVTSSMGYTRALVRSANENDFRTAMRAYGKVVAENFHITTVADQPIFDSVAQLEQALRRREIEVIAGLAHEIFALPPELLEGHYFAAAHNDRPGVEYVLLTRADRPLRTVPDLARCTLAALDNNDGALALPWLESLCHEAGLPRPETLLREIRLASKPSQAVLPVFFGQVDACIVTRASFAALAELNPQIERRLHLVAASPRVAPFLTALRAGLSPELRERIITALTTAHTLPAGRQALLLFQTESVRLVDQETLSATRQLLAAHTRLAPAASAASALP